MITIGNSRSLELNNAGHPLRILADGCMLDIINVTPETILDAKALIAEASLQGRRIIAQGPQEWLDAVAVIFMAANMGCSFEQVLEELEQRGIAVAHDGRFVLVAKEAIWRQS